MKNIFKKLMMLTAIATLGFLYSCNNDDEEPAPDAPVLEFSAETVVTGETLISGGEVAAGDTVRLTISVTAAAGFNTLRISGDYVGEATRTDLNVDAGTTSVENISFTLPTSESDEGATRNITITAVDDSDGTTEEMFSFDVGAPLSPEARVYTTVLLAAPLQDIDGSTASKTSMTFFSTNTGDRYSMAQVLQSSDPLSADIDFGYFYGSGDSNTGATLTDPDSYPFAYGQEDWGTRNSTTFRRTDLDASAFAEVVTYADIDEEFDAADPADSDAGIESGLAAGEVLAFETDSDKLGGSKRGLILVNSITGTDGEDGEISLEILVQEEAN